MHSMSGSQPLRRKRLARLAILAVLVVRLGVAAVPHTGSYSGASFARPHLHTVGDQLEVMHNEAACPVCSGLQLGTQAAAAVRLSVASATTHQSPATRQNRLLSATQDRSALSRAPPVA